MNWNEVRNFEETLKNDPTIRGKIVGMSFVPGYPANLYSLFNYGGPMAAVLTHNPNNAYDSNACEVHSEGVFVGHLPKELAAEIAPRLDGDECYTMKLELLVTPGAESNPGISFSLLFWEGETWTKE